RMTRSDMPVSGGLAILLLLTLSRAAAGWGLEGHVSVTRGALAASDGLPPWFRAAGDGLAELSNAPDRWREVEKGAPALAARRPDHFFDLDVWGAEPLPPERWAYVARAARRRLSAPAVGFLPFAIGEEYGVLLSAFRDVRTGRPGGRAGAGGRGGRRAGTPRRLAGAGAAPLPARAREPAHGRRRRRARAGARTARRRRHAPRPPLADGLGAEPWVAHCARPRRWSARRWAG